MGYQIDGIEVGTLPQELGGGPMIAYHGAWECSDGFVHRRGPPGYNLLHPDQLAIPGVREALQMGPTDAAPPKGLPSEAIVAAVQIAAAWVLADQETKPRPPRSLLSSPLVG